MGETEKRIPDLKTALRCLVGCATRVKQISPDDCDMTMADITIAQIRILEGFTELDELRKSREVARGQKIISDRIVHEVIRESVVSANLALKKQLDGAVELLKEANNLYDVDTGYSMEAKINTFITTLPKKDN